MDKYEIGLTHHLTPGKQIDLVGLAKTSTRTTKCGIPLLKEIPWLGRLFEFERETKDKNMLVIQLKADVIPFKHKTINLDELIKKQKKQTTVKLPLPTKLPKLPKIIFEPYSTTLSQNSIRELTPLVIYLQQNKKATLELNGYTDNSGDAERNKELSLQRAKAVKKVLMRYGINPDRITTRGFGDKNPIADNNTSEGRIKNRRIEIKLNL